jgi:hypothetical protein
MNPAPDHCWKHCLGLEDSDGVLNMVEDKVEGGDAVPVPDGEGGTLLYQQVNNLNRDILLWIWIQLLVALAFKMPKKFFFVYFLLYIGTLTSIFKDSVSLRSHKTDPHPDPYK